MKVHEFQAKQIIAEYGAPVLASFTAQSIETIEQKLTTFDHAKVVVKAQIHAGGRGKGGGVKVCDQVDAVQTAKEILGMNLITPQTDAAGQKVKTVLIEQAVAIKKELYFSILIDRVSKCPIILASTEGGMDIEEVSEKSPEKIITELVDPTIGLRAFQAQKIAFKLKLEAFSPQLIRSASQFFINLYRAFMEKDASLLEINPCVITEDNQILALDCKMAFDDNALFRHHALLDLRDLDEENEDEIEASKYNLNFIKLDGKVGCMVNGAGLAMATMDIIQYYNGSPANFLDVGGNATEERVEVAFQLITKDPKVRCIFINIFGGIVRCDIIARALVNVVRKIGLSIPVVARLRGTNSEEARALINAENMGDKIILIEDLSQAAQKAVELSN